MKKSKLPPKWTDVYPQGTKAGDEEQGVFISLSRHPKYQWRSTAQIAKEANLTKERVEEILSKYYKKNMIFQNPSNPDQWGYWERLPDMLPREKASLTAVDHKSRIDKLCDKTNFVIATNNVSVYSQYSTETIANPNFNNCTFFVRSE